MITLDQHMMQSAREYLVHVLDRCAWNIVRAAKMAGRNRADFYRLMKKHGIERPQPAANANRGTWAAHGL